MMLWKAAIGALLLIGLLGAVAMWRGEARKAARAEAALEQAQARIAAHGKAVAAANAATIAARRDLSALRARNARLRASNDKMAAALKREPERAARVGTYLHQRGMRDICRASGGTKDQCKIEAP